MPDTIGKYDIVGTLGAGGMGKVYAARDRQLGRTVAIKSLHAQLVSDTTFVDRFRDEAKILANLSHPNITMLYDLLDEENQLHMVMELVRGHALENVISRLRTLSVRQCQAVISQAAAGLSHAHRMGVIHRDIKPANMMITEAGIVKVMDFGIARVAGSRRLTRTGSIVGTLAYMPPEAMRGLESDQRGDLYSLACVVYEMLGGAPPFDLDTEYEMIRAHIEVPPARLRDSLPALPLAIDNALMRALAKDPAERFETIDAFSRALGAPEVAAQAADILLTEVLPAVGDGPSPPAARDDATRVDRSQSSKPGPPPPLPASPAPAAQVQPVASPIASPGASPGAAPVINTPPPPAPGPRPVPPPTPSRMPLFVLGGVVAVLLAFVGYEFGPGLFGKREEAGRRSAPQQQASLTGQGASPVQPVPQTPTQPPAQPAAQPTAQPTTPHNTVVPPAQPRPIVTAPVTPSPVIPSPVTPSPADPPPRTPPAPITPSPTPSEPPVVLQPPARPAPSTPEVAPPVPPPSTSPPETDIVLGGPPVIIPDLTPQKPPAPTPPATAGYRGKVVDNLTSSITVLPEGATNSVKVRLFGISDPPNMNPVEWQNIRGKLKQFLASNGGNISCQDKGGGAYQCFANNQDIALWMLRTRLMNPADGAPAEYLQAQYQ